jgi:hypothetical protein
MLAECDEVPRFIGWASLFLLRETLCCQGFYAFYEAFAILKTAFI